MQNTLIPQLLAFALVSAFGFFLGRKSYLTPETASQVSGILVNFVLPLTIIRSFLRPFEWEEAKLIFFIFLISLIFTAIYALLARLIFGKDRVLDRYAAIFSNKGFVGIPLVTAIYGSHTVIYVTPSIIMTNLLAWTYGTKLLGTKENFTLRKLLMNPNTIAFFVGLALYMISPPVPDFLSEAIALITAMNSPLAMIMLGFFLSQGKLSAIFNRPYSWFTAMIKLLVFPALTIGILMLIPGLTTEFKVVTAIIYACPTALNFTMQASIAGQDTKYAAQLTSLMVILSMVSMPLIFELSRIAFP